MPDRRPSAAARIGRPLHLALAPVPTVCFIGTLLTDITYANTADMQWANFSVWLLTAGLVIGAFAVLAGLLELAGDPAMRRLPGAWLHTLGTIVVMLLALWNVFVHSRDAWTSVVPTGLTLSIVTVVVMVLVGWIGGTMLHRERARSLRAEEVR